MRRCLQFFVDAIELGGESPPDISILGIEGLLECLLGLPQSLSLSFVGFYIGGEVIQLLLSEEISTSTFDNLFLSDI